MNDTPEDAVLRRTDSRCCRRRCTRETRKSNDGLLLFLGGVALMALLGCAVCTAVACRVMHEARQVETQQER